MGHLCFVQALNFQGRFFDCAGASLKMTALKPERVAAYLLATRWAWRASSKENASLSRSPSGLGNRFVRSSLLGCHLFGFAFLAHDFQFALGGFDLGRHFLLNAGCRFLKLR